MRSIYTLLSLSVLLVISLPAISQSKAFKPITGGTAPAGSERRLALVVGNTRYIRVGASLVNPTNDADDMAKMLDGLGFAVLKKKDLDRISFEKTINEFGRQLKDYDVGLVYYSGHGVQFQGENYLVPTDEDMNAEPDIPYYCVNLGRILAAMEGSNAQTNIVLLDACRNNPFPKTARGVLDGVGLTIPRNPPGTLVAFATSENSTADDNSSSRNGLFTSELLKYIGQPNRSLDQILTDTRRGVYTRSNKRQTPADYNKLLGEFVFVQKDEIRQESVVRQEEPKLDNVLVQAEITQEQQAFNTKDYRMAFRLLSRHANKLGASDQNLLGYMYLEGLGVNKDYNQALNWFSKSAFQGDSNGQNNLGYMYQEGLVVSKDYGQAVNWFNKSAAQGNAAGQNSLGTMYQNGWGVTADYVQAVDWFSKSATQGNATGQYNLGYMFEGGFGVEKNILTAIYWFQLAARQGQTDSQSALKRLGKTW